MADSGPGLENYDLFHAQSPDSGRGLHAHSWRENRDVDFRRYLVCWVLFEGRAAGSVARWPLQGKGKKRKKKKKKKIMPVI